MGFDIPSQQLRKPACGLRVQLIMARILPTTYTGACVKQVAAVQISERKSRRRIPLRRLPNASMPVYASAEAELLCFRRGQK